MTRLAVLLRDHSGPLEADLERFYRRDLLDFWRGKLTMRKLGVLVSQLPAGAETWRAVGSYDAWTDSAHISAHIVDHLAAIRRGSEDTPPVLIRPGAQREEPVSEEDVAVARAKAWEAREAERQRQLAEEVETDG